MGFKEIGQKIQQARELKGYSQEQLARMIGCSQSALSNYEKGKRRLYLSQLEQIAEALKMPIDYFMESKTTEEHDSLLNSDDKEAIRLLHEIYNLSAEERRSVWEYIGYIRWRRLRRGDQNDQPGIDQGTKKADSQNSGIGARRNMPPRTGA